MATVPAPTYPVRLEGELDASLSRWLWLVKWILAIPHYLVLAFLWLTVLVLTTVAFFAILVTGRYPRGIFDFNLGVFRWTWRVAFYSYAALGTDRYPPFTLRDVPDYPARLDVEYPEQLSRGLVLVKSWLLAIPHYAVIAFLVSGGYLATRSEAIGGFAFFGGLITLLAVVAGVTLLFTRHYPPGSFDLVVGLDRWVARVAAYAFLMRDEYPPFRLDQGGREGIGTRLTVPENASAQTGASGIARAALVVAGVVAGLLAFVLLAGGVTLIAVESTQRDAAGYLMSPSEEFATSTYALTTESLRLDTGARERAVDAFLGDVRVRGESDGPLFIGIGSAAAVERYLSRVEHDVYSDFQDSEPTFTRNTGTEPSGVPNSETFWEVSASGFGARELDWNPTDGEWRIVVMNADASRGVSAEMSIGAQLDSVLWIGLGLLFAGGVVAAGAAFAIGHGARGKD